MSGDALKEHNSAASAAGRPAVHNFTDLRVWQIAMDLAEQIYRITRSFPPSEQYGLASQLQRAAVSIPSNIAEGHARHQSGDYIRFLGIARGSLAELKTQVLLAIRLGYIMAQTGNNVLGEIDDLMRQLTALRSAIERRKSSGD